ncbi:MAG: hypothetical protein LBT19_01130 [Candidatus Nomurabacteria bacterium]|jgi:nanoRNase/pAp phosphatase (c-di-AMP/oligoRNAs hydrolase)|nr:hypothetical protein [Candidatus Nomurabacteria bacterium]
MADEKRPVTATKPTNDIVAQVAERIKSGDNVLVALSKDPTVDELSAAIGLTFLLDKMGKHATAIFSGAVPNAIEFLEPEKTFEVNTNSLQDFIIALDKDKADHLRYKIDGDYVKVYITPYKTTIEESDLEFSHGDFNVDLVIALDVASAGDLDGALAEHGRIMHDASSINISTVAPGRFGDLQWSDPATSSVSEMIGLLADRLKDKEDLLDKPIATALLAGIVAATNRFSNEHTMPATMNMASRLMEAGADQQLISSSIPVDSGVHEEDVDAGMPAEEPKAVEEPEKVEETKKEEPVVEMDASHLQVQHGESEKIEVEEQETPEQQLEKIIQDSPMPESTGPLMDELREAAGNQEQGLMEVGPPKVIEPLGAIEEEPQKDYASLMDNELSSTSSVAPAAEVAQAAEAPIVTQENVATQVAPVVPSTVEINGIPAIDYGQAPDSGQVVGAPELGTQPVEPVAPVVSVEVPMAESVATPEVAPVAPVVEQTPVEVEPPVSNLPMPDVSSEFLPPPPPPFDPGANVGAVDFTPTQPAAMSAPVEVAQPVQEATPIVPAVPEAEPEVERGYLGSNPAMQDQVYPPAASSDPGAFQLPTTSV